MIHSRVSSLASSLDPGAAGMKAMLTNSTASAAKNSSHPISWSWINERYRSFRLTP
jgi:hypothetical protein